MLFSAKFVRPDGQALKQQAAAETNSSKFFGDRPSTKFWQRSSAVGSLATVAKRRSPLTNLDYSVKSDSEQTSPLQRLWNWRKKQSGDRTAQLYTRQTSTIQVDQRLVGKLSQSDSQNLQRQGRYQDKYRLTGVEPNQILSVQLRSSRFDAYLQVIDTKTGKTIFTNDDKNTDTTNAHVFVEVNPNVNYQLRVTSYDRGATGRYVLKTKSFSGAEGFHFDYGYGLAHAASAVARAIGQDQPFNPVANLGGSRWGLDHVGAPEVWKQGFTGQDVVVAVLDTGVNYRHPDLKNNIWINPNEIPANGIDDDGNGFIDDIRGWKFVDDDSNRPMDREGHGSHVAGTIAAARNGFGTTGVAYNAKIMPVKVIDGYEDASPSKFDANLAAGIRYAVQNGAKVISMSLGNFIGDPAMVQTKAALQYAREVGAVAVMASGNEKQSHGATRPIQPAFYAAQDLGLAIGATNRKLRVANFSNPAGARPLDFVVAPGVGIRSTSLGNRYTFLSGTSMATPHVAGIVALMLSANPNLTPAEVENILVSTARTDRLSVA